MSAPWGAGERTIPPAPGWPGARSGQQKKQAHMDVRSVGWPCPDRTSPIPWERTGGGGSAPVPSVARLSHGLDAPVGRECQRMPLKDRLDAETARILQPKDPRFPRRLPSTPGAVQGGVRPVMGGDRPPSRDLPPHHTTLEVQGRAAQPGSSEGAA